MMLQNSLKILAALIVSSGTLSHAADECANLPKVRHRIVRFVENPTFAKLNPKDAKKEEAVEELKPVPVYVVRSSSEEGEALIQRVELVDAIASGDIVANTTRPDCTEGAVKRACTEHEKSVYREKSMKDYEVIVDKMKRMKSDPKVKIKRSEYAKLEGMEFVPSPKGNLCMLAADLEDEDAAPVEPNAVKPTKPAAK